MMRRQHKREFYIPKGAMKFADRESSAVVFAYERHGKFLLMGFHGRAQKPDFHYSYPSREKREAKARSFFEGQRANEAFKRDLRGKRMDADRGLEVGDILRCSWGYEQTNVDYFEVTALIGKRMVEIREIASESYATGWAMGRCAPMKGKYIGEPMRKIARGGAVSIYSFASAYKVEPKIVGGVPVFETAGFTTYG